MNRACAEQSDSASAATSLGEIGMELFHRLRRTAQTFDARLRRTFTEKEL